MEALFTYKIKLILQKAFEALATSSHILGRRVILEWAKTD